VILYIIEGRVRHEFGAGLKHVIETGAGDSLHQTRRSSRSLQHEQERTVVAFVARSSADEWDNIIPYQPHIRRLNSDIGRSMLSVERLLLAFLHAKSILSLARV